MCRKIVIADDEPITRMNIAEMLEEAGYEVVGQAADGFDAVEICKRNRPDLAMLDVKMPLLDGLNAAKIIISEGYAKALCFLQHTAVRSLLKRQKCWCHELFGQATYGKIHSSSCGNCHT